MPPSASLWSIRADHDTDPRAARASRIDHQTLHTLRPPSDVHLEPPLHHKERRLRLERPPRVHQLELKVAEEPGDDLVDLQQREVPPDADVRPAAELDTLALAFLTSRSLLSPPAPAMDEYEGNNSPAPCTSPSSAPSPPPPPTSPA